MMLLQGEYEIDEQKINWKNIHRKKFRKLMIPDLQLFTKMFFEFLPQKFQSCM